MPIQSAFRRCAHARISDSLALSGDDARASSRSRDTPSYSEALTFGAHCRRINTIVLTAPVTRNPQIAIIGSS